MCFGTEKNLGLPRDYHVDACIIFGGQNDKKYKNKFLNSIKNKKPVKEKLKDEFIKKILSVKIGKKRIWFFVEYGSTRLSEFIHFASILGSKINLLIGSCGGLKKGLDEFSLIIPSYSYSTESSAHMYTRNNKKNKFYPSAKLSKELKKRIEKEMEVVQKPTITCQAMMGETWQDIKKWSKEGFYGVEMEASTVFAVSKHFKVQSSALLYIADNLIKRQIVGSESFIKKKNKLEKMKNYIFKKSVEIVLSKI